MFPYGYCLPIKVPLWPPICRNNPPNIKIEGQSRAVSTTRHLWVGAYGSALWEAASGQATPSVFFFYYPSRHIENCYKKTYAAVCHTIGFVCPLTNSKLNFEKMSAVMFKLCINAMFCVYTKKINTPSIYAKHIHRVYRTGCIPKYCLFCIHMHWQTLLLLYQL